MVNITRDIVALVVLHGMVSSPPEGMNRQDANEKNWAKKAYDFADAYIKERESRQPRSF